MRNKSWQINTEMREILAISQLRTLTASHADRSTILSHGRRNSLN